MCKPLNFAALGSLASRMPTSCLNCCSHCTLSAAVWFQGSSLYDVRELSVMRRVGYLLVVHNTPGLVLELFIGRNMTVRIVRRHGSCCPSSKVMDKPGEEVGAVDEHS